MGEKNGEGRTEEKKSIALNLLSLKIPLEDIAQSTGLTEEEIEQLKKSLNKHIKN